ncbi:MAG: TIGR01212 family radical SAM protein [Desulfovibrionaceae bacterium]|nr:TIGR01212 family radical SAM protein [Desulfovibrionaceae bacterium]
MNRHYALSAYLGRRFAGPVRKIPLDAGFSCPNRDGTLSTRGCLFCNPRGSGTGLWDRGLDLAAQWEHWRKRLGKRHKSEMFFAYLQSFSNTHGPIARLARVLDQLLGLPGLVGISLGTRPDCLDRAKLDLLAEIPVDTHLEIGLQSANDKTLRRVNRGHDSAAFARAAERAARRGLLVCAHLVAGLPGEHGQDLLRSVDFVNELPVHGVKFHNAYVCRDTGLADMWRAGAFAPPGLDEYADWLCRALARLRPDAVVHRLAGDPAPGELLAPVWAGDKPRVLAAIMDRLKQTDTWQGKEAGAEDEPPAWFEARGPGPEGQG